MTETEYLISTNRAKVSATINILRTVSRGDEYGIKPSGTGGMIVILNHLQFMEQELFDLFELEVDE